MNRTGRKHARALKYTRVYELLYCTTRRNNHTLVPLFGPCWYHLCCREGAAGTGMGNRIDVVAMTL